MSISRVKGLIVFYCILLRFSQQCVYCIIYMYVCDHVYIHKIVSYLDLRNANKLHYINNLLIMECVDEWMWSIILIRRTEGLGQKPL